MSVVSSPVKHSRVRLTSWPSWGWILISNLGAQFLGTMIIYSLSSYLEAWKFGQRWLLSICFTWSPPMWATGITWWRWTSWIYMKIILTQVLHSSKVLPTLFEESPNYDTNLLELGGVKRDGPSLFSAWANPTKCFSAWWHQNLIKDVLFWKSIIKSKYHTLLKAILLLEHAWKGKTPKELAAVCLNHWLRQKQSVHMQEQSNH